MVLWPPLDAARSAIWVSVVLRSWTDQGLTSWGVPPDGSRTKYTIVGMGRRTNARGLRIAHAGGTASGYATGSRRDLDHDGALAEIRDVTTDPAELAEAAGLLN